MIARKPHKKIMDVLASNWGYLRKKLLRDNGKIHNGYNCEDIMLETFECVIRRDNLKTAIDDVIIKEFMDEHRRMRHRFIKTEKQKYKILFGSRHK